VHAEDQNPYNIGTNLRKIAMEYELPFYDWNMASVLINEVGKKLQAEYGDHPLKKCDIEAEILSYGIYKPHSIFPSDYSYNLINRSSGSFRFPLFIWLKRGYYIHVGPGYPYTGPIYWKGNPVGEWVNGAFLLWVDPRK
jgi:hypothetical protein